MTCSCQTNCSSCGPSSVGCGCAKNTCSCNTCVNKAHTSNCACGGSASGCSCANEGKICVC
ncbi:hypothetical protein PLICRDRAFT_34548 [Plicaturopsis crispa FD-325 SS-3]|nr:hypothetical protein PLICRDRAFT_34548 [Plicaturopsis crispa FD-325 SS-3]